MTIASEFLVRLRIMDRMHIPPRQIILLYAIIANPGINGKDLATKLGFGERSHIQQGLTNLMLRGMIEDRRAEKDRRKANPAIFYVTDLGLAMWDNVKP